MEHFISKRNQVFRRGGVVVKRLAGPRHAETETELLRAYHQAGVSVPRVFERRGNEIVMEYISGETIPDFLSRMETEADDALLHRAARELCRWFQHFYAAVDHARSGEIRGDVNGRNFIIAEDRVLSVDFEERAFGTAEQDIGRLLAFIRTYDLAGEAVNRRFAALVAHAVLENLRLSAPEIIWRYRQERIAMQKRRN